MSEKYAIIDIGTNSVRLLLAKAQSGSKQIETDYKKIKTTRLGENFSVSKILSPQAIERTATAVISFYEQAQEQNVATKNIFIFATSAARESTNKQELLNALQNYNVEIVSGEVEAKLAALGALAKHPSANLVDIGGGSVEFACKDGDQVSLTASVAFGCVVAKDSFGESEESLKKLVAFFEHTNAVYSAFDAKHGERSKQASCPTKKLLAKIKKNNAPLYAVGGSATCVAAYVFGLRSNYDSRIVHGRYLTLDEIERAQRAIIEMSVAKRKSIAIIAERADVIIFGIALLIDIIKKLGQQSIIISDNDNLEGYLIYKLSRNA